METPAMEYMDKVEGQDTKQFEIESIKVSISDMVSKIEKFGSTPGFEDDVKEALRTAQILLNRLKTLES